MALPPSARRTLDQLQTLQAVSIMHHGLRLAATQLNAYSAPRITGRPLIAPVPWQPDRDHRRRRSRDAVGQIEPSRSSSSLWRAGADTHRSARKTVSVPAAAK